MKSDRINQIRSILPSIENAKMFSESTKENVVLQIKELQKAIDEKYERKIKTNISFEVIDKNKFICSLELKFKHFSNWFHFISFGKKLDENFPVELFAFADKKSFGIAENMEDFDNILTNIIKSEKTECLILSNL